MSCFTKVLSEADARLRVPEPARSRILLEIAADMEDLHREYLERGYAEGEADAAVLDHFELSEEVLQDLVRVHDTTLQRSLEKISGPAQGGWSRLFMAFLALFSAVGSGNLLFRYELYRDASGLIWIVMPLLAIGLVLAVDQARRLYWKGNGPIPVHGLGVGRLLGLGSLMLGVTAAGLWLELYLSALRIRTAPGETLIVLLGWLRLASATLVIVLSGALVLGFLWFFLESQIRRRELAAVNQLLEGAA